MIKLIAFDLNGVLTTNGHVIREILSKMVDKEYAFVKQRYILFSRGIISREVFWESLDVSDEMDRVENNFLSRLSKSVSSDFFIKLKESYKIAVVSNFPRIWFDKLLHNFEFDGIFDFEVVSGDVGVRKPDPFVYLLLKHKSNIDFREMLFVDDKKKNLKPPKLFGMKTVWLKREEDSEEFEPDFTISSLNELKDILAKNS